jgi:hypothetical protein
MEERTGAARLRQAITNQATCGSGQFELSIDGADRLCREIEAELENSSWAKGVPAPRDADGEVVPLTTKVMYGDDGRELEVSIFKLWNEPYAMQWRASCTNKDGGMRYADVSNLHLTRPDSWEKLEEDAKLAPRAYLEKRGTVPGRDGRVAAMAVDIVRRAKVLAEVGADDRQQ